MSDIPSYLRGKTGSQLHGLDKSDLPGGAKRKDALDPDLQAKLFVPRVFEKAELPKGFKEPEWLLQGTPRQVQLEGLRRSYYGYALYDDLEAEPHFRQLNDGPHRGWAHYMEMRLGKTPITLNEYMLFRRDHGFKWLLMLTPSKFKLDWPVEGERFGIDVPGHAFESTDAHLAQRFIDRNPNGGLISVNYEALGYKKNLAVLEQVLGPQTMIGADEAISIKGGVGLQAKAAIDMAKQCGARRPLTGKPITQGPHDLWAQLRFAGYLDGFNQTAFRNAFSIMGGFQGKKVIGVKNEERLQRILDTSAFTARRKDWMKTPGREYAPERRIKMLPEQERIYIQMEKDFLAEVREGVIVTAEQVVTKLMKLQQISSGFIIDEFKTAHDLMPASQNPKLQETVRMLREEISGKVIVFAHFRRSIELLQEALAEFEPAIIRGRMGAQETLDEKTRFNTDPRCRVMIGQTKAIKFGHTLMGTPDDPCTASVYYENSYSLDDRSQTEERNQGSGQVVPVTLYDIVASEQDYAPIRAVRWKEDISAAVFRYARGDGVLPPLPALVTE